MTKKTFCYELGIDEQILQSAFDYCEFAEEEPELAQQVSARVIADTKGLPKEESYEAIVKLWRMENPSQGKGIDNKEAITWCNQIGINPTTLRRALNYINDKQADPEAVVRLWKLQDNPSAEGFCKSLGINICAKRRLVQNSV